MDQPFFLEKRRLMIIILMLGVFGIINTEMGIVGILPLIAEIFNVSLAKAGGTVSIFALVVALSGPTMPLLFSRVNRKNAMLLALGVFILGNIISAITRNFEILLVARVISAFFQPVYVSIAFSIAATSFDKEEVSKSISKIFVGVSAGMVLGIPITSFIASEISFEMSMIFFMFVNIFVFFATLIYFPSIPNSEKISYKNQLGVLRKPIVWHSIIAVIFINGAIFGFFSYLSDYLKNITGVSFRSISLMLFIYGVMNIVGNIIAGKLLSISTNKTVRTIPFLLILTYALLFLFGKINFLAFLTVICLGIFAGIASNSCQYIIMNVAYEARDFANGLFLTAANLGTAIGTFICGLIISNIGIEYVMFGSIFFLVLGASMIFFRERQILII